MNDGGGESGRGNERDLKKKSDGGDDFSRAIVRIAVAQICETAGFQSIQQSALEALSNIMIRYLCELGKNAHFYANFAGRTDCNVFDIIQGLEDLGSAQGFPGASDINCCIASSGTVREIMQYVSLEEEVPFSQPIPRFPVIRNRKPTPSFLQIGETPDGTHIPSWLPAFPDAHTYAQTPTWNERETDPRTDKIEQSRQRTKAEWSLLSLQQRLACSSSEAPTTLNPEDARQAKQAAESNPFLASPLQFGEKDVSPVLLPTVLSKEAVVDTLPTRFSKEVANRPLSALETFAPVIKAAKGGLCDSEDGERKVIPNKRPFVHFKFRAGKKSFGMPLDLTLQNKALGKTASWFGIDDEKDDKKRRAEEILKESMENPQELTQL